jgi:hypothetical protein
LASLLMFVGSCVSPTNISGYSTRPRPSFLPFISLSDHFHVCHHSRQVLLALPPQPRPLPARLQTTWPGPGGALDCPARCWTTPLGPDGATPVMSCPTPALPNCGRPTLARSAPPRPTVLHPALCLYLVTTKALCAR